MKKKILVTYARYGSGHKSIAEYIASYIKENNKNADVLLLDMTEYSNLLGKFSVKVMDFVAKRRPELLFDACYEATDHRITSLGSKRFSKRCFDNKKLREFISSFNPDITISSHFYCSNILAYYNELKITNTKIISIITDYRTHAFWTGNHQKQDAFIVGNDIVKEEMIKKGVDRNKIYSFGLPLNINKIANLDEEEVIINRYKLDKNKKTYLFFGGSTSGSMFYYDYFKAICNIKLNKNIIFICGKNEKLKRKCDKYVQKNKLKNIFVLGYSTDVFNLLKISSLVISKPGGATVTECLEMKVPMLLVPGVGGQEKYNAKFIVRKRYGIKARWKWRFKRILRLIENNPSILEKMHNRLLKLDKNDSVKKINNLINKM